MLSIGPFPATTLVVALAVAAAIVAGALAARRYAPGKAGRLASLIMDMALVGLLAARLGFVVIWWQRYLANPWSVIRIGDGGYLIWFGALVALLFAVWRVRKTPVLKGPMIAAMLTGWMVWIVAGGMLTLAANTHAGLPDVALTELDGGSVQLAQLSGKPMVVNLWATWCPPCRREMPMLEAAQQRHPGVTFVFVNQRQGRLAIRDYLRDEDLQLTHVVIDEQGVIARSIGSGALPTTLFYDADGRLVDAHVGMLTAGSLAARLQQFDLPATTNQNSLQPETKNDA